MVDQLQRTKLSADMIVIQGMKDKLVSPKNPEYVAEHWQDYFNSIEIVEIAEAGHFLPWRNGNEVVNAILKLTAKITAQKQ